MVSSHSLFGSLDHCLPLLPPHAHDAVEGRAELVARRREERILQRVHLPELRVLGVQLPIGSPQLVDEQDVLEGVRELACEDVDQPQPVVAEHDCRAAVLEVHHAAVNVEIIFLLLWCYSLTCDSMAASQEITQRKKKYDNRIMGTTVKRGQVWCNSLDSCFLPYLQKGREHVGARVLGKRFFLTHFLVGSVSISTEAAYG